MIAASNLLEKLDPALLRPGRFDRQIFVSPPDLKGRRAILDVHTRDKPLAEERRPRHRRPPDERPDRRRPGQPLQRGRDLRRPRPPRSMLTQDFQAALERVIAGVQSRRVITEHEKRVVAYHEAGHALCSELLPSVEKVHRISIIPRGKALGYTLNLPEEDRYLKTKDELLDYLVVLLGGRVTEHSCSARSPPAPRTTCARCTRSAARWSRCTAWAPSWRRSSCRPTTTRCPTTRAAWSTRSSST